MTRPKMTTTDGYALAPLMVAWSSLLADRTTTVMNAHPKMKVGSPAIPSTKSR